MKVVGELTACTTVENLDGNDTVSVTMPASDQAVSFITEGRVLRLVFDDASFSEWKIRTRKQTLGENGIRLTVGGSSPLHDLADATIISETLSSGVVEFDVGLFQVALTEVIDNYVLAKLPASYGYFARGTVDPTALYDIQFSKATPLALLRQLADAARDPTTRRPAELRVRRNGTTNYLIDIVTEIGASQAVADIRSKKNVIDHDVDVDSKQQATVIYPFGGADASGRTTGIERVAFTLDNGAANVFEITDPEGGASPVLEDDQLNGMYVVPDANGALIQITDSAAGSPATITLASSTGITDGNVYELRASAAGVQLTELSSPSAAAAPPTGYGRKVGTVDRPDIVGVHNLVPNSFLRTWTTPSSAPDGWSYTVGAAKFSQNTDALYTQYGGKSLLFDDSGFSYAVGTVRSPLMYPRVVAGDELFSWRLRLFPKVFTGACWLIVQLLEASGSRSTGQHTWIPVNHPLTGGDAIPAGAWREIGLDGIDLTTYTAGVYLEVIVQVGLPPASLGQAELYFDAFMVVQGPATPSQWVEYSSANALWHAGNLALSYNKDPLASYDINVVDRTRLDGTTYPHEAFVVGGTIRDTIPEQSIDGLLVRITRKTTNWLKEGDTRLEVATPRKLLSDVLGGLGGSVATVTVAGGGGGSATPAPPSGGGGGSPVPSNPSTPSGGTTQPTLGLLKTIIADAPSVVTVLENMPSTLTDLGAEGHFFVDFTNVPRAYLTGSVVTTASPGGVRIQYRRESDATWRYLDGTSGPELLLATSGRILGASVLLETDARGPRWCRTVAISGDDADDGEIGHLALHGGNPPAPISSGTPTGDWSQLIQLLGGDAEVPFFYDGRDNISLQNVDEVESIDDVRGSSGYGPQITSVTPADWPTYISGEGSLQFRGSGSARQSLASAAFAGVDLAGPFSLIVVGRFIESPTTESRRYYAASVTQEVGGNYALPDNSLGIRMTPNAGAYVGHKITGESRVATGAFVYEESDVGAHATDVRVAIVTQDGATAQTTQVPDDAAEPDTMTAAFASASSYLWMGGLGNWDVVFGGDRYQCDILAMIGVNHVLNAVEVAAVMAWAEAYRGATRA